MCIRDSAYSTCGFAVFTNCYTQWLSEFDDWKQLMQEFFNLPLEKKQKNIGKDAIQEFKKNPSDESKTFPKNFFKFSSWNK